MSLYKINLSPIYWDAISSGLKKVEGRLNINKHSEVKKGDIMRAKNIITGEILERRVKGVRYYNSFEMMLTIEGTRNLLPFCDTFEECVDIYKNLNKNNIGAEENNGVVAIEI